MTTIRPFHEGHISDAFRNIMESVRREIDGLENQYVLKASPSELEDFFVKKVTLAPLQLHVDQPRYRKSSKRCNRRKPTSPLWGRSNHNSGNEAHNRYPF